MPAGGAAVALNQDGSLNSPSNPAAGGSIVTVWATGAGISLAFGGDGAIASELESPLLPVSVLNSGNANESGVYSLAVLYAGSAPELVTGALQVNFQLPANLFDVYQLTCQLQVGSEQPVFSLRAAVGVKTSLGPPTARRNSHPD
jgi:uncharacterized protein (TIGR03437 family)